MTLTDLLAVYGAILATGIAAWDLAKYTMERARLRVTCYVGKMATPGVGVSRESFLVYNVANTGGKPIVVSSLGGALHSGPHFVCVVDSVQLPKTLQPGESLLATLPLPDNIDDVREFTVHDGLGNRWCTSPKAVRRQIADAAAKAGDARR